jgi:hypothetical protein
VPVGALLQKAGELQAHQKSSDLPVQCSAQRTVLLFKGEYTFPGKTQHHLTSLLTSVSCASYNPPRLTSRFTCPNIVNSFVLVMMFYHHSS